MDHINGYLKALQSFKIHESITDPEFEVEEFELMDNESLDQYLDGFEREFKDFNGFTTVSDYNEYFDELLQKFKHEFAKAGFLIGKKYHEFIHGVVDSSQKRCEDLIKRSDEPLLEALLNVHYKYCIYTIEFLSEMQVQETANKKKPSITTYNGTILKQKEVSILVFYMQKLGILGKGINKTNYADLVAELTGYSKNQIRQALSNLEEDSQSLDKGYFSVADFNAVNRVLRQLSDDIFDNKPKD